MFLIRRRAREENRIWWYRDPAGELVEFVKRHGRPGTPDGVWLTVEDADHIRHDYPAHVLEEVRT